MNNSSDLSWSQPEHQFEPIGPNGEEEFANLLDLDLDINFPTFDSNGDDAQNHGQPSQAAHLTHIPQQNLQPNRAAAENAYQQQQMSQFQQGQYRLSNDVRQQQHIQHLNEISQTSNSFSSTNIHPPYAHHQQPQPQQFHNVHGRPFPPQQQPLPYRHTVPPTPNSMEMHGDAEKYLACLDPQTRATLEQRYQLRNDDPMSFTPLVSPAVTPHETQFQMPPEFTIPGAYFSPLTSPMLGAQRNSQKAVTSNPRNTVSPAATSPVDPDVDMLDGSTEEPAKKLRKKISNSGPRAVANATRMRQSPLSKAQRKRGAIPGVVTAKEVSEMFSDSQRANARSSRPASSAGLNPGHTRDSSEAESISPEPLSESVMRPPPKPSSKTQSPAILPQNQSGPPTLQSNYLGSPATPASLMRIQQQQAQEEQQQQIRDQSGVLVTSASTSDAVGIAQQGQQPPSPLGEFALPEAAGNTRPQLQNIDTSATPADDQATPRVFAREAGTPGSAAGITPGAISATVSAKPSPRSSAIRSPSGPPGSSGSGGKIDSKGGRNNKKRNSTSSALVSPALRPKISPSIKPLLPEGVNVTDEHHALLLASKSNYQNLIDGTRLPGVNYPQELSTNLTSKRTSHKIAEQGRRNRINTALQEMQSLLPSPNIGPKSSSKEDGRIPGDDADSGSAGQGGNKAGGSSAQAIAQSNSKAATVESAIEYIKQLQREAERRDQEIEGLKKQLGQTGPSSDGPGTASTKVA